MKKSMFLEGLKSSFPTIVILISLAISIYVFKYIFGDPSHFQGGNIENNPVKGDYFGVIYKGGMIVPILMTFLLMTVAFSIERFLSISRAKGRGSVTRFMFNIKEQLKSNNIDQAIALCDKQRGSLANVIRAALHKFKEMKEDRVLNKEQKTVTIQKELEEAIALELPMMSRNLPILSTLGSISTLVALIGTVLGMIRAFAALATSGAPDAVALATGISEALINTAFGITVATFAIIFYNYFNTQIDSITYKMDEAGFILVQTFAASEK